LATLREPAEASGLAAGTHAGYDSAERYFGAFCAELGLNQDVFGLPESAGGFTPVQEDNIFELFAVYGVHFPRDAGKIARGELNTGETIAGYITGVKSNVELRTGRRPGLPDKENRRLRLLLQGLRKEAPRGTTPRPQPILQAHLRAVRALLDLEHNPRHRVLWAFWLQCWQTVCRTGDLIRGKRRASYLRWDPAKDLHRGRHSFEPIEGAASDAPRYRSVIQLVPGTKTDQTGEKHFTRSSLVDLAPDSLSAGAAVARMLAGDPVLRLDPAQVPLFRDPATGRELTYRAAKTEFKYYLVLAGYPDLAGGMHSLRRGGATAATALSSPFVAGCMGCWASDTKFDYMWALRDTIEATALSMGRGCSGPVANPPAGPVGRSCAF
jgi:hypothetical protein